MKTQYVLLSLACSALALLSCSMPVQQSAVRIEPVLRIRNSDSSARGFYQVGRYHQDHNRDAQAIDAYRSALRHDPDNIDAHSALGAIYALQGKYEEAIAEFSLILKMAPQLAYIHNNLGYAHYLRGNYGAAVAAFEHAIALAPQDLRALNNLGLAHQKMGDAEQARLAFSQAAKIPGATGTFVALAADAASAFAESVPLPTFSATSVSLESPLLADSTSMPGKAFIIDLESSAPAVRLGHLPSAAATATPAADGNDSKVAVAPQEYGGVQKTDALLDQLFSAAAPATALSPSTAANTSTSGKAFHLEIANGNGIAGFARKIGDRLARDGLPKPQLANLNSYRQHRTLIQYRAGFHDEAVRLSHLLQTPPVLLSKSNLRKNIDVRLILGNDVASKEVLLSQHGESVRLAESGSEPGKIIGVTLRLARKLAGAATQFL